MLSESIQNRLSDLLLQWEELHELGQPVTPEELCADCPELADELSRRIEALQAFDGPLAGDVSRPTVLDPSRRDWIGNHQSASCAAQYDDLQFHAAGGLGEVFRARGEDLGREVALKFIRGSHAQDPNSRRRFLREAIVTGRLEHPGVVPVYGMGTDREGNPCYAMRFIRGRTFEDAIKAFHQNASNGDPTARTLDFHGLLRRFIAVCNTVAYAHGQGVVHRDLKPRNIMMGSYNETLVVDWGLARPYGQDVKDEAGSSVLGPIELEPVAPTAGTVGTPGYMSPEQAEGVSARVGPASDIYSLGATLYFLLTGRSPFSGQHLLEVLDKVRRGEFPTPRTVQPAVSPALESICLKAMATRPEDRYATAMDLAEDLERWLADEPVSAWREPWYQRLGRWARRHRTLVATTAALLGTAVLALAIGLAVVASEQRKTAEARDEALANFREAEAQRLRADANLTQAREAVDRYFMQISENRLLNEPGFQGLRQELLESARDYYQQIADSEANDPNSRADLGRAYLRLAQITAEIDTPRRAIELVEQAQQTLEQLGQAHPEEPLHPFLLASTHYHQGHFERLLGRLDAAEAAYQRAQDLQAELAAQHPEDATVRGDLAATLDNLGGLYYATGRMEAAAHAYDQAHTRFEELARDGPDEPRFRKAVASTRYNLALVDRETGQPENAREGLEQALELREAIARDHPDDLEALNDLISSHAELALHLARDWVDFPAAEPHYLSAVEVARTLARDNPQVNAYQQRLARALNNLAILYQQSERLDQAIESHEEALDIRRRLVDLYPEIPDYQSDLAASLGNLAMLYRSRGDATLADSATREARELFEVLAHDHPEVIEYTIHLGTILYVEGLADTQRYDWEASSSSFDRAVQTLKGILEREPSHPAARSTTAFALWAGSNAQSLLGRHDEALADLKQAEALDDGRIGSGISHVRSLVLARRGDIEPALAEAERVDPTFLVERGLLEPGGYSFDLACLHALCAQALGSDAEQAASHAVRALDLLREAAKAGYFNDPEAAALHLGTNPDLDAIRHREDFQELAAELGN